MSPLPKTFCAANCAFLFFAALVIIFFDSFDASPPAVPYCVKREVSFAMDPDSSLYTSSKSICGKTSSIVASVSVSKYRSYNAPPNSAIPLIDVYIP